METGLSGTGNTPLRQLVDKQVMGFGTTVDEKIIGVRGLKKLLDNQKKQSNGLDIKWKLKPVYHTITPDENTAVFADDIYIFLNVGREKLKMYLRFSIVLSFSGNRWKVIHWHGSKPENVESEKDTFGVETWKEKAEALEKLVAERTADLLGKNRELEVEFSLERVRAVAMGMKQPAEMLEVCEVITRELISLGIATIRNIQTAVIDTENESYQNYEYYQVADKKLVTTVAYKEHPVIHAFVKRMVKNPEGFYARQMKGVALKEWIKYQAKSGQFVDPASKKAASLHYYFYSIGSGALGITSYAPLSKEAIGLFKRFRNVFQLAYARFVDIRQAEEQAREAQIEAALERVRSRSMAMHKSDELKDVIRVVLEQFIHLNIKAEHAGFYIDYKAHDDMHIWLADPNLDPFFAVIPYFDTPTWNSFLEAKTKGIPLHTDLLDFKTKNKFYTSLFRLFKVPEEAKQFYLKCKGLAVSTVLLDNVGLYIENFSAIPYTDQENEILMRFGKVFQQTYTRFLDLQKAEAQTSEAQIEAALERVRSRAMAMHTSAELKEVALELRKQMGLLGQKDLEVCAIHLYDEDHSFESWSAMKVPDSANEILQTQARFPKKGIRIVDELMKKYNDGEKEYVIVNAGAKSVEWFSVLKEYAPGLYASIIQSIGDMPLEKLKSNWSVADFSGGAMVMVTYGEPDAASRSLLRRSANVFEQAYIRFLDLKKAEAQAKEAQIEAALEKVRSRTMAMQSSNELQETAAVLFTEFKKLGTDNVYQVTIGIYNEEEGLIDFRVTSWAGSGAQENRSFQLDMNEPTVLKPAIEAWKANKKSLVIDLSGEALEGWLNYRNKMSGIAVSSADTAGRRVITVAYYSKGHLSISTPVPVPGDTQRILERFAAVFDSTYTRFLDLKKAEAQALRAEQDLMAIKEAKQKAEEALAELQITQRQLIQAEKMASLGELTAGIAHEIQNPLNFVNNFSEVSKELLDEMKEAIEKGDTEEANEIMNDVIQNLEKINHHGKRADGIVKGMLQHSRRSSGVKEPTDINALADEYLRLAYHGLRAKDKSFNAVLKTEFDDTISKINVIPQDIGRVILNLITNAFYAVDEKKKQQPAGYEPAVIVTTRKISTSSGGASVVVTVKDNGNGIPQQVIDKIFQPFFTTKPTGQGTGLGLSLSYDIVKTHGGELKVETKEGEGSEFMMVLHI